MLRAVVAAKKKNDRIDATRLVRQMVQTEMKISTLLMEAGISYNKSKLHLHSLLGQCREMVVRLGKMESALFHSLSRSWVTWSKGESYIL